MNANNQISFDRNVIMHPYGNCVGVIFTRQNKERIYIAYIIIKEGDTLLLQNEKFPTLNVEEILSITREMKRFTKKQNGN